MYETDPRKELITVKVDVSGLAEKLDNIEQVSNHLTEAVGQALGERLNSLKAGLAERNEQVLEGKLGILKAELANNQNNHHDDLAATLQEVQDAITDMKGKLQAKEAYDAELHAQEQRHNDELRAKDMECQTALQKQKDEDATVLEEKKKEFTETISHLQEEKNQEIQRLKDENASLRASQNDVEPLRAQLAAEKDALGAWEEFAKPYSDVQQAMEACPAFGAFREEKGLHETFDYIRTFGSTLDFAIDLFDFMAKVKLETKNPNPMTPEEQAVYTAVNACYCATCHIEHDVFRGPEPGAAYDKSTVEDMEEPKNRWKKVQFVYVPVLYSLDNGVYKLGKVRGKN